MATDEVSRARNRSGGRASPHCTDNQYVRTYVPGIDFGPFPPSELATYMLIIYIYTIFAARRNVNLGGEGGDGGVRGESAQLRFGDWPP